MFLEAVAEGFGFFSNFAEKSMAVPRGQTHPQNTRPNSSVKRVIRVTISKLATIILPAMETRIIMRGLVLKKRSVGNTAATWYCAPKNKAANTSRKKICDRILALLIGRFGHPSVRLICLIVIRLRSDSPNPRSQAICKYSRRLRSISKSVAA